MVKKIFILIVITLLLSLQSVYGLNVPEDQKNIFMTIERGNEGVFHLLLKDINEITYIKASGDFSSWVTFGETNVENYIINTIGNQGVRVIIFVPNSASLGDHNINIEGNDAILSEITVTVVEPLSKILDTISDEIQTLKTNIETTQDDLELVKTDLSKKIEELYTYQKTIDRLESEKETLLNQLTEAEKEKYNLEKKNTELTDVTGKIVTDWSSIGFSIGVIVGIIIAFLFVKRNNIRIPGLRRGKKYGEYKPRSI